MKRVLVTGASGFIGRAVCEALRGHAWVRATSRSLPLQGPWDASLRADLSQSIDRALVDGVDTVLHCAGTAHVHAATANDDAAFEAGNVAATQHLCDAAAAAGVARVVLAGSVSVLGEGGACAVPEDALPSPLSGYARSKLAAERIVQACAAHAVILRFPLVYGPGLPGNLARMIDAMARGRFPMLPMVMNRRSMIHVQDAARAMLLAGMHDDAHGTYTVTDGRAYATRDVQDWILAALGRPQPAFAPPMLLFGVLGRAGDVFGRLSGRRAPVDSASLGKLFGSAEYTSQRMRGLGFTPEWDLERAMPGIVAAQRRVPDSA